MSPYAVILTLVGYFIAVVVLGRVTARRGDFFATRSHRWWVVTLAMVSACMSGVSFVSVPGMVAGSGMGYLQMCIGFFLGYLVIAFVLTPLYFRLGVVSVYEYLDRRFGVTAHRWGAWLFFVSQLLRASLRLSLLCLTQQLLVFAPLGLPFVLNVVITVGILLAYTWRGGVRSVIAADILRTVCMVSAVVLSIIFIGRALPGGVWGTIADSGMTRVFWLDDANAPQYFWKQLLGGFFIVIAMTGMDQDMMQRNLACRSIRDSQKNLVLSSLLQIVVITGFLLLGVLLYAYADYAVISNADPSVISSAVEKSLPTGDALFPTVAVNGGLPLIVGVLFILGLAAASYGAGGSALTALTTAFVVDILPTPAQKGAFLCTNPSQEGNSCTKEGVFVHEYRQLRWVHLLLAGVMAVLVILFGYFMDRGALDAIYTVAGYTYGPILGLFSFGILTRRTFRRSDPTDKPWGDDSRHARPDRASWAIPVAVLAAPLICLLLNHYSVQLLNGYRFGYELLPLNAALTFLLLYLGSIRKL